MTNFARLCLLFVFSSPGFAVAESISMNGVIDEIGLVTKMRHFSEVPAGERNEPGGMDRTTFGAKADSSGHGYPIQQLALSRDGHLLAFSSRDDYFTRENKSRIGHAFLIEIVNGTPKIRYELAPVEPQLLELDGLRFTAGDRFLLLKYKISEKDDKNYVKERFSIFNVETGLTESFAGFFNLRGFDKMKMLTDDMYLIRVKTDDGSTQSHIMRVDYASRSTKILKTFAAKEESVAQNIFALVQDSEYGRVSDGSVHTYFYNIGYLQVDSRDNITIHKTPAKFSQFVVQNQIDIYHEQDERFLYLISRIDGKTVRRFPISNSKVAVNHMVAVSGGYILYEFGRSSHSEWDKDREGFDRVLFLNLDGQLTDLKTKASALHSRTYLDGLVAGMTFDSQAGKLDLIRQPFSEVGRQHLRAETSQVKLTESLQAPIGISMPILSPPLTREAGYPQKFPVVFEFPGGRFVLVKSSADTLALVDMRQDQQLVDKILLKHPTYSVVKKNGEASLQIRYPKLGIVDIFRAPSESRPRMPYVTYHALRTTSLDCSKRLNRQGDLGSEQR